MRNLINIVSNLTEGVKDSPQFIENPNSSGQGRHPEHDRHSFHDVLQRHSYRYSHTTPIRNRDGMARRTRGDTPEQLDAFLRQHVRRSTILSEIG